MQTVLIIGGSGLIGRALSIHLMEAGYRIFVMGRSVPKKNTLESIEYFTWNPSEKQIDQRAFQEADHIINLAGAGVVDKRWSKSYKKLILDSRVESGNLIRESLQKIPHKVKTLIQGSAIGWYGPDQKNQPLFHEESPAATDFLGSTCKLWEQSVQLEPGSATRLCIVRTGIVFSNNGGAYPELKKTIPFRLAAIPGSGKQIMSWIHIRDLCNLFQYILEHSELKGIYNAVADKPVATEKIISAIAEKSFGRQYITLKAPALFLKILMGESSIEVLKSTSVSNEKIRKAGFQCKFPDHESAINDLISSTS